VIIRAALASGLTAAGTAAVQRPPPTEYGVPEIILFGMTVNVGSALIAAGGALLLRLVIGATDGWKKGDFFLALFLMIASAVMASDYKAGPGISLIMGGSIGAGGMAVVKFLKDNGVTFLQKVIKAYKAAATETSSPPPAAPPVAPDPPTE
jgi:hypothetical protein